jgi:hypothetical protein
MLRSWLDLTISRQREFRYNWSSYYAMAVIEKGAAVTAAMPASVKSKN